MVRVIVRFELSEKYRKVTFINSETCEAIVLKSRNVKSNRIKSLGFGKKS